MKYLKINAAIMSIMINISFGQSNSADIVWFPQEDQLLHLQNALRFNQVWFEDYYIFDAKFVADNGYNSNPIPPDPNAPGFSVDYGIGHIQDWRTELQAAIRSASLRGVTHLEVTFYGTEQMADNNKTSLGGFYEKPKISGIILKALDDFNNNDAFVGNSQGYTPIDLYIRIPTYCVALYGVVKNFVSVPGLPSNNSEYCAYFENGTQDDGLLNIADYGNQVISNLISEWIEFSISTIQQEYPNTDLTNVTLSTTYTGESSLWPNMPEMVSFSGMPLFDINSSVHSKAYFFKRREEIFKSILNLFATKIHTFSGITATVNETPFTMVAAVQEPFDLLDGTNIDHITDGGGNIGYFDAARSIAFTSSLVKYLPTLSMGPTELTRSWGNDYTNCPAYRETTNCYKDFYPDNFLGHMSASLRNGSIGFNYVRWMVGDMIDPPNFSTASPPWSDVIGPSVANDNHLANILLDFQGNQLSNAKNAIYISTLGRVFCTTENLKSNSTESCDGQDYSQWFNEFDLNAVLETEKVDIITDGMIINGNVNFDGYDDIFLPFEVSKYINIRVLTELNRRPNNSNINWQSIDGQLLNGNESNYNSFGASVKKILMEPIVQTVISPLLL